MAELPVLTARWSELLLLNWPVPVELIAEQAPLGTEPDLYRGQAFISVVGFRFQRTRLFGVPIPGHTQFGEINLRYYVRRIVGNQLRRGVVFVKEIVSRRAVSVTANWLYNENYITRPLRCDIDRAGSELTAGDSIQYAWQSARPTGRLRLSDSQLVKPSSFDTAVRGSPDPAPAQPRWNRFTARLIAPPQMPIPGSFDEFIIEHYWGYVRGRDGRTREYRVTHEPWSAAPVDAIVWDCDLASTYDAPWTACLAAQPSSALVADGSLVQLFRGRKLRA